jgi:hypothetical protein
MSISLRLALGSTRDGSPIAAGLAVLVLLTTVACVIGVDIERSDGHTETTGETTHPVQAPDEGAQPAEGAFLASYPRSASTTYRRAVGLWTESPPSCWGSSPWA